MSLTQSDLQEIRSIVRSEVRDEVRSELTVGLKPIEDKIDSLAGRIEALESDVREIYRMLAELQKGQQSTNKFLKLSLEEKILKTYHDVVMTAKQAGITLPRQ